jgi:predicted nucleic acid-binding protein
MIAVDSNLLVYAHREDSPWHDAAYARIVGDGG